MKRSLAILSMVALVSFAAQARAAAMYGGIKAGANFANLSGDQAPSNTSNHTGFMGGLFAGEHVNENIGFRVEALWVQKGAKYTQTVGTSSVDVTGKLDYIEFPLLFVYDFPAGEKMGFNLFAGPTLGFNVSAKAEANGQSQDVSNVKNFEFGGAIGAGVEKKMKNGKGLGLDVRYSMGATSISNDVSGQSVSVKNRGIGVMASLSMPLGKSKTEPKAESK